MLDSLASRWKCLNLIILDSWEKFDETIQTWYKYSQVQEAVEEFLLTEAEWNTFLASLDRKMVGAEEGVQSWKVAEPLSFDTNLVEARYVVPGQVKWRYLPDGTLNTGLEQPANSQPTWTAPALTTSTLCCSDTLPDCPDGIT